MAEVINPAGMLKELVGQRVQAKLKWGSSYIGTLVSCDAFMNLQLRDTNEVIDDEPTPLGEIVLRCNNILYIRRAA